MTRRKAEPIGHTYVRVERKAYKRFVSFCRERGYTISTHASIALEQYALLISRLAPGTIDRILKAEGEENR